MVCGRVLITLALEVDSKPGPFQTIKGSGAQIRPLPKGRPLARNRRVCPRILPVRSRSGPPVTLVIQPRGNNVPLQFQTLRPLVWLGLLRYDGCLRKAGRGTQF